MISDLGSRKHQKTSGLKAKDYRGKREKVRGDLEREIQFWAVEDSGGAKKAPNQVPPNQRLGLLHSRNVWHSVLTVSILFYIYFS